MVDHLLWCFLFLLGIFTLIFDDTDCASPHPRANLLPESLPRIACLHRTMKIHEIEIARCKEDVMCLKPWKRTHVKFIYFCACCELGGECKPFTVATVACKTAPQHVATFMSISPSQFACDNKHHATLTGSQRMF